VGRSKAGLMLIPAPFFRTLSCMYGINLCVFSHMTCLNSCDMSLVMFMQTDMVCANARYSFLTIRLAAIPMPASTERDRLCLHID
jgi:hypothetical protein